tara:strand:+ start:1103 stop:1729 length:627 start_codon:yes stop_codon:yes gene_type:complete
MSISTIDRQLYTLAALYQSCNAISRIAWEGKYDNEEFSPLIKSILDVNSDDPLSIYEEPTLLKSGFEFLKKQVIDDIFTRSSETRRYISSIKNLVKRIDTSNIIDDQFRKNIDRLNEIKREKTIDDLVLEIGQLYIDTFSKVEPRIVISGDNQYLKVDLNAARIRTALMAAIRSVYLWKSCNGSDFKFFLFKKRYIKRIKEIIVTMQN